MLFIGGLNKQKFNMSDKSQANLGKKRRLRAKFLAMQKLAGKNLQNWPDKKSQLRQSSKPIASNDQKKADITAQHAQVKQESKLAAKRALDWEPIFPIEEELPKYRRVVVKGGEAESVRYRYICFCAHSCTICFIINILYLNNKFA
jgi:hypothetical protein